MDLRRHSQCHRRLLIALIVSLLSNVCARRNRETPMPSTAPSISKAPSYLPSATISEAPSYLPSATVSEAPSYLPSATPSFRPSLGPSSTPSTLSPSLSPSQDPTGQPTPSPTGQPTPSPSSAPTSEPTLSPSSAPSASFAPTLEPTLSPSSAPSTSEAPTTEEEKLVSVPMPVIGITFFLDDDNASSSSFLNLDTKVTDFLQYVLAGRSDENFEYVSLYYVVTQFAAAERRRLKTGVSVEIEGMALYGVGTESPATGDIADLLQGYFSFWGIQDLEDHLHATGLPSAQDVQVSIGGSIVEVVTDEENPDGDDIERVPDSFQTQDDNDDPPLETGGIFGVVVGSVFLVTAISLAAFYGQKKRRELNRQELGQHSPSGVSDVSDVSESAAAAGTGRIWATPLPEGATPLPEGSSDGVSTDNSLYTTDASIIVSPIGVPNSYDVKRLDKVIAAAKQSTADGESSFV